MNVLYIKEREKREIIMNEKKNDQYVKISKEITEFVGGEENILGVAHCATRLRIVVEDQSIVSMEKIEEVELVKGAFVTGDQIQIIFGAGLVNEVYEVFAKYTHKEHMSLQDVKGKALKKQNPLQQIIKSLSDVFIEIMPAILAAALLMGLSGLLGQKGLFGEQSVVDMIPALSGLTRFISIVSSSVFSILPLIVVYSATKRYGGRPILGLVIGALMLSNNLADAYQAAQGSVAVESIHLLGLPIELVGFQGGIIIALMMGFVVAKLDLYFEKKIPNSVKLLLSPMFTVFIAAFLLFTIIGPVGRILSSGLTSGLLWMTQNLGFAGYAIFGGVQQIIVVTGLHHLFGAIEGQLLVDTGRDFINPLASVAVCAQGGAVLGYLAIKWKDVKTRELCIPAFTSTLFGISEPAIFGINLRHKYPFAAGCIASALASTYVYFSGLTALGYGTTVLPGFAIVAPEHNGYVNYIIAHLIALAGGILITIIFAKGIFRKSKTKQESTYNQKEMSTSDILKKEGFYTCASGNMIPLEEVNDPTFSSKAIGEGIAVLPEEGCIYAPMDAKVISVFNTKHAICLVGCDGTEILLHIGIDTVNLKGKYFHAHVSNGDDVQANDKLISFDLEKLKEEGYDTTIMMIFTDKTNTPDLSSVSYRNIQKGERF